MSEGTTTALGAQDECGDHDESDVVLHGVRCIVATHGQRHALDGRASARWHASDRRHSVTTAQSSTVAAASSEDARIGRGAHE